MMVTELAIGAVFLVILVVTLLVTCADGRRLGGVRLVGCMALLALSQIFESVINEAKDIRKTIDEEKIEEPPLPPLPEFDTNSWQSDLRFYAEE